MTVRNPLFEFMPYGAPELLSAQRTHLVRALALASLLALTVFALARALGLTMPGIVVVDLTGITRPAVSIEPPPSINPATAYRIPSVTPTVARRDGQLVVVHDEDKLTPADVIAPPTSIESPPSFRVEPAAALPHVAPTAMVKDGHVVIVDDNDKQARTDIFEPSTFDAEPGEITGDGPLLTAQPGPATVAPDVLPGREEFIYTDELPVLAKVVKPDYPDLARQLGIEGRVYVHMLVGKDGRVVRAEVDEKINVPMLNAVALEAARKWVFQPALVNKHAVAVWVGEAFIFKINQ